MASSHSTKLIITTIILSIFSIACFLVAYFVNVWWITETNGVKETVGLWKTCTVVNSTETCQERKNLFSFPSDKGTDPIITCLIISAGFTVFILFSSLSIVICFRKKPLAWYKTIKWLTFFVIISFVAAIDAMVYTEIEFREVLENGTRGWAYMISWAGTGLQFILFVLILVQLCIRLPRVVDTAAWWYALRNTMRKQQACYSVVG